MQTNIRTDQNDYWAYCQYACLGLSESPIWSWSLIFISLCFLPLNFKGVLPSWLTIVFFSVGAFILISYYSQKLNTKHAFPVPIDGVIELSSEGIFTKTTLAECLYYWKTVLKLGETKSHYFICIHGNRVIIINRELFTSLEEDLKFKTSLFEFAPQLNSKTISRNKKPPLWAEIFGILCGLLAGYYIFKLFF